MPHIESPHEFAPVEEEPDDALFAQLNELELTQPKTYDEFLYAGRIAYGQALAIEEKEGELTPEAIEKYKQAGRWLIDAKAVVPLNDQWEETVPESAERLIMIADSFERQALAPGVEPYQDPISANWIGRGMDRRKRLRHLAGEYTKHAVEVLVGKDDADKETPKTKTTEFDQRLASAVVTAELMVDGNDPPTPDEIHKVADDLLEHEGSDGIVKVVEENAYKPQFVEELAPRIISLV